MTTLCPHRTERRCARLPNALWKLYRSCPHHQLAAVAQAISSTAKAMDGLLLEEQVHDLEQGVLAHGLALAIGTRARIHYLVGHLADPDRAQDHQKILRLHPGHQQLHIDLLYLP